MINKEAHDYLVSMGYSENNPDFHRLLGLLTSFPNVESQVLRKRLDHQRKVFLSVPQPDLLKVKFDKEIT